MGDVALLRGALLLMPEEALVHHHKEVCIRTFGVGLLAIAALAMAGILLSRRRRPALAATAPRRQRQVDDIYAAGW
ncbi:MAG TPA: hypothetical protein VJL31_10465 [Gemmatimonadales bacterium]|nr:hypothetical protein [Gemmatimonadales bacterium]